MKVQLTNLEFETLFDVFKKTPAEGVRHQHNSTKRIIPSGNNIICLFSLYKLTDKQFKKIVDYCIQDDDKFLQLAFILGDTSESLELISDNAYEYALTQIKEQINMETNWDLISSCFYFKTSDYYSNFENKKARERKIRRQNITIKCIQNFNITDKEYLVNLEYFLRDSKDTYRCYNFNCAFNDWLDYLSQQTNGIIDSEYFELEDNLEEYYDSEE